MGGVGDKKIGFADLPLFATRAREARKPSPRERSAEAQRRRDDRAKRRDKVKESLERCHNRLNDYLQDDPADRVIFGTALVVAALHGALNVACAGYGDEDADSVRRMTGAVRWASRALESPRRPPPPPQIRDVVKRLHAIASEARAKRMSCDQMVGQLADELHGSRRFPEARSPAAAKQTVRTEVDRLHNFRNGPVTASPTRIATRCLVAGGMTVKEAHAATAFLRKRKQRALKKSGSPRI